MTLKTFEGTLGNGRHGRLDHYEADSPMKLGPDYYELLVMMSPLLMSPVWNVPGCLQFLNFMSLNHNIPVHTISLICLAVCTFNFKCFLELYTSPWIVRRLA
jgi:hypothetical protein